METTKQVKAKKVREGDFLPGLDDAYVFMAPEESTYGGIAERYVAIYFHVGADGEEGHLDVPDDMLITVIRRKK